MHTTDNQQQPMDEQALLQASSIAPALQMQNGSSAPLDAVPVLTFSAFNHLVGSLIREDCRVVSLFALPVDQLGKTPDQTEEKDAPGEAFRLVIVLASNTENRIYIAATEVGDRYPSLTPRLPQLHLFERELYEKHGLLPVGHPWLKPVRFEKNDGPSIGSMDFYTIAGDEVHEVAVGPIHAGIIECGHFRFQCLGELVMHLEISLGYHHRGVESLLAHGPHPRTLPLMEAVSGDSTIAHTWAYCTLLEALTETSPSPRGQIIRSLALELERLANHTGDLGAMAGDVGFLSTLSFCGRLRGDWLNMSAMLCGSRFGRGLVVPGGTAFDVDAPLVAALKEKLFLTARDVQGAVQLLWDSPSVMARMTGIGTVDQETALALGLVGPAARASGLMRDARHTHPLPGLPLPPELAGGARGDARARAAVRHDEITASVAFCRRMLEEFLGEEGDEDASAPVESASSLVPGSIAVSLVEGWRGEVCHVALTGSYGGFLAYVVTDPSFHNWAGLGVALRDQQISDFPLCNKSFNLSYCGHDL